VTEIADLRLNRDAFSVKGEIPIGVAQSEVIISQHRIAC